MDPLTEFTDSDVGAALRGDAWASAVGARPRHGAGQLAALPEGRDRGRPVAAALPWQRPAHWPHPPVVGRFTVGAPIRPLRRSGLGIVPQPPVRPIDRIRQPRPSRCVCKSPYVDHLPFWSDCGSLKLS